MNQALYHRGPDEAGQLDDQQCSLAMRRLSIIDTTSGQQPIYNEIKTCCVFFNGEIYNYPELKKELIQQGHHFKTNSDTEVLVHLYESYGTAMLPKLRGMFAFCIYDIRQSKYLFARDQFGEKPFYYHFKNDVFSFSSEIKSLLENSTIQRQLNQEALPYYFRTSLVPEPITLYKDIFVLNNGHYLVLDKDGINHQPYIDIDYPARPSITHIEEAKERIEPLLKEAVKKQLISDVPVGAFLSGGIDSSTIVALMQQESDRPIPTFTVRFENQDFDESKIAQKVAEYCGTDHHELFIPNLDFSDSIFWTIIDHVGLPFRDSSAIPSFQISQEISKHVKVALSGDGGDELFGGYSIFQWYQKIVNLKNIASPIRSLAEKSLSFAGSLPGLNTLSPIRKIKRGIHTSLFDESEIPIALNELFKSDQMAGLLKNTSIENHKDTLRLLKQYPDDVSEWSALRKIMYYRLRHTLPANMLIKVDRMSMANSLEVRTPFLDSDLFEASTLLSDELLIKAGKGKYIIREMMKKHLPSEVFSHPKTGFSIPLYQYQNKSFRDLAKRLLFDENPWPDFFSTAVLKDIYERGINQQKDTAKYSVFQTAHQLWMMMQLLGWAIRFKVKI